MAARAVPDADLHVLGPVHREGHETDFANLKLHGWVDDVTTYLVAAEVVIASAGDNTVHEIARARRPFICAPEWRYFDEQKCKARELARLGAAIHLESWPGSLPAWQQLFAEAQALDVAALADLYDGDAACNAARWLTDLARRLWSS